ncbi:MAG: hypothetical protein ACFFE4_08650 [Candidatus Thorarchaeota archaeon]
MKRSKLIKVSLLLMIAIYFLGCVSSITAASDKSKVTNRPFSHWTENNPGVVYGWGGWPPGVEKIFPPEGDIRFYRFLLARFWEGPPPEGTYDGYIKERELSGGRALVTVVITLKDSPFWVSVWPDSPADLTAQMFADGKIVTYREVTSFYIEYPGAPIPFLFDIPVEDLVFGSGVGHGIGIFTAWAEQWGFTPGERGMAFVNQRGLFHAASRNGFKGALEFGYSAEIVDVRQIG